MADLFLELLSEEIPARMQARAAEDLARLVTQALADAGLAHGPLTTLVGPRRLALAVADLPVAQPDTREERRGPRADAPDTAIQGFLGSVGLTLDQVERRETPKGPVLFAVIEHRGRPTAEILPGLIGRALLAMPWPKSMRWGRGQATWVRPLHGLVVLFDGQPLPGALGLGNAAAGRRACFVADPASQDSPDPLLVFGATTRGHRFLAPDPLTITGLGQYRAALRKACVMVDPAERRQAIAEGAQRLAEGEGLRLRPDPGLLDEVTGLVEWPVPLMGHIDPPFMDLPPEVLITSMRSHQKYFALEDDTKRLSPRFIVIANTTAPDSAARVVSGNERVLRARLADARFFWDQDRKTPLADKVARLGDRIFHARLGSDLEKVSRLVALAARIAPLVPGADPALVARAAHLAKADLVTGMVGEFPELQGLMGRYYALHDGEPEAVAEAIRDHYAPVGPADACPTRPVSLCVALADKLDTLAGFWLIDDKPTGSKDPFALRRAGLGVIRLIVENGLRLSLRHLFAAAARLHLDQRPALAGDAPPAACAEAIAADLLAFIADRLKVRERERGVRHDLIAAVFALDGEDDLVRLLARVAALSAFLDSPEGADLLAAARRAMNIVRIEEKKDGAPVAGSPDPAHLVQDEERTLAAALSDLDHAMGPLLAAEDFAGAMTALARLRAPVDAFFDAVTVNAEDAGLRTNRLRLLALIGAAMNRVADFSRIEGSA